MLERTYQARFIKRLRKEFDGCLILKNDSQYLQGVPDLIVLFGPFWAMLEVKADERSRRQPNQDYYVQMLDEMSFSAFVFPSNEDEVVRALQSTFGLVGVSRTS